jgi:8-oxo-(d)GTP phosphatase
VSLLLIRHASAGDPHSWEGDDRDRSVDERGRRQAAELVSLLAEFPLERVVSSPYLRCLQTVEPLAKARGIEVETDEALSADRLDEVPSVLERLRGENAAVCTHADLPWLGDRPFSKGSVWVVDDSGEPERYLPPPA